MTYSRYRQHELGSPRPPVVFLPGIMGSRLVGVDYWGPYLIWGTEVALAALPKRWDELLRGGNGLNNFGMVTTDVPPRRPTWGLTEIHGFSVPYRDFVERLDSAVDLLVFPYDWRISNDVNAVLLEYEIKKKWFRGSEVDIPPESRVSIVAHSMGGLLARSFIEERRGCRFVKQLITAGTPHQGAPSAYGNLIGAILPLPTWLVSPKDQLTLINFCGSVRQLLPNYDFVQLPGGAVETRSTTYAGMTNHPSGTSVAAVISLLRDGLYTRPGMPGLNEFLAANKVEYHCMGSAGLSTAHAYDKGNSSIIWDPQGDGTVPLASALCPDEVISLGGGLCSPSSNIHQHRFTGVVHKELFNDHAVQDRCFSLLGVSPPARKTEGELVEALHLGGIERELELMLEGAF